MFLKQLMQNSRKKWDFFHYAEYGIRTWTMSVLVAFKHVADRGSIVRVSESHGSRASTRPIHADEQIGHAIPHPTIARSVSTTFRRTGTLTIERGYEGGNETKAYNAIRIW